MNKRNIRCDNGLMRSRAISAMLRALWRIEASKADKSCTPPMNMVPTTIHTKAGAQPNALAATMGPTIGPAPAMEEKW